MIKCVILDDEPWAVELLVSYLNKVDFLSLSLATTSPFEALRFISNNPVDLVFLDINMQEMTGIQVMEIMAKDVPVIITSAYPEYAVKGYDFNAIDYLLKPIEYERFLKAALKADYSIRSAKAKNDLGKNSANRDFIFIKTDGKLIRVKYDEILYIEGKRDYISISTITDRLISLDTLSNMEGILPATSFIRIHKSFILALDKITFVQGNRVCVNKDYLPIGETYKNTLLKAIRS